MLNAAATQPLSAPWRRADRAARLHVTFDRVASLVVEDPTHPLPRLHARVFEVELIARMSLVGDDGATVEKRTIAARLSERDLFVRRVTDTAAWATEQHAGLAITTTHDRSPLWSDALAALQDLGAELDERVRRTPVPREVTVDRRLRAAR